MGRRLRGWGVAYVVVMAGSACSEQAKHLAPRSDVASQMLTSDSFKAVSEALAELGRPEETLVVMDNDSTLTKLPCPEASDVATCQYFGGTTWFNWQSSLSVNDPQRSAPTVPEILRVLGLALDVSLMDYVEDDIPAILAEATAAGATLLVETARGPEMSNGTADQFNALRVPDGRSLGELTETFGLKMANGVPSLPGTPLPCGLPGSRPISYVNGVAYVAGQDKAEMLRCLLSQALDAPRFSALIFIDDSLKNVQQVFDGFSQDPALTVVSIHYTAQEEYAQAFTEGERSEAYQRKAADDWTALKAAIESAASVPNIP